MAAQHTSIAKAYKKLGLLKKLQFNVSRKILSLLYATFYRPQLEYASKVWSCWSNNDSDKLEKLQLAAAKIVNNNITSIASLDSLYHESWWDLDSRKEKLKTTMKK